MLSVDQKSEKTTDRREACQVVFIELSQTPKSSNKSVVSITYPRMYVVCSPAKIIVKRDGTICHENNCKSLLPLNLFYSCFLAYYSQQSGVLPLDLCHDDLL